MRKRKGVKEEEEEGEDIEEGFSVCCITCHVIQECVKASNLLLTAARLTRFTQSAVN